MNSTVARVDSPELIKNRPLRILCVDDDPDISRNIELRLTEYRVEVRRAFFGMQGFWDAITEVPDLIIMDVAMPNGDGSFVLESLKQNQKTAQVPVIILTGMRDKTLRRRMFNLGANQFIRKPIRFEDLFHEISRFIPLKLRPDGERGSSKETER